MKSLLYYLIQVIAVSGILYGYYHLALRNKRFHRYNRFFLLAAIGISTLIPFINIPIYFNPGETASPVLRTLAAISPGSGNTIEVISSGDERQGTSTWFTLTNLLYAFYILVTLLALARILFSLRKIRSIIKSNTVEKLGNIHFVNTNEPGTPFSFLRWLFWNKKIELTSAKGEQIFRHELFHIREKHSLDILFMEMMTVIFWINPFFHLIKREIKAIHEFLADQFAIKETSRWEYAEMLLMQALNTPTQLVNPFFHTQIKRRIAMITSSSKPGHQYLRKLLVLPIAAVVVGLFAFTYKNKKATVSKATRPITVLIDAGHGGIDPGVKSPDSKYTEARLTLEIAKTIQQLSGEYNITVRLTRDDDHLPGNATNISDGLKNRTVIANEVKPDAFVAIHMNSAGKNEYQSAHSGIEAYITNKKDDQRSRLLASTLLQELAGAYTTSLEIQQREGTGIYILDHSSYPAVLLECGYINNAKDLAFITNKSNQEETARAILKALADYANTKHQEKNEINVVADTTKPLSKGQVIINGTLSSKVSDNTHGSTSFFSPNLTLTDEDGSTITMKNVNFNTHGFTDDQDTSHPLLTKMLFIIDGKEQPEMKAFKDLDNKLNPNDINSINVWKGESAVTRFGEKGKNGVIEIITRKGTRDNVLDDVKKDIRTDDEIFDRVEIIPTFPGGVNKWKEYLMESVDENAPLTKGAPDGIYTVIGHFIVKKDGSVENVKALTNFGYGMEEQVVQAIKKGPKWLPAIQNGKAVNSYHKIPVTFVVVHEDAKNTWNASVSTANNMNILFAGIDNPVTIKTSEKDDKNLIVTISKGIITGTNGKYIVRVEKEGEVIITVRSGSGKTSGSFPFKVKLPEAKNRTILR